ncbi:MAG: CBS domain-containing protein [Bdellovibrio sp.]|nr:CBS domain-containing protein [Bdellovibrio sp.]
MSIEKIMRKDFVTVPMDTTILEAARLMLERHVGDVIILDEDIDYNSVPGSPIGILTDRDIVLSFAKTGRMDPDSKVSTFASGSVMTASVTDGLAETIKKMSRSGIRRIPVLNPNKKIVGVLYTDDCLELLGDELNSLAAIVKIAMKKERLQQRLEDTEAETPYSYL